MTECTGCGEQIRPAGAAGGRPKLFPWVDGAGNPYCGVSSDIALTHEPGGGAYRYVSVAGKGTVAYDEVALPVTGIELRCGTVFVTATGLGPAPEHHGLVRLYGPDGLLVTSGGPLHVRAAGGADSILVELTLELTSAVMCED